MNTLIKIAITAASCAIVVVSFQNCSKSGETNKAAGVDGFDLSGSWESKSYSCFKTVPFNVFGSSVYKFGNHPYTRIIIVNGNSVSETYISGTNSATISGKITVTKTEGSHTSQFDFEDLKVTQVTNGGATIGDLSFVQNQSFQNKIGLRGEIAEDTFAVFNDDNRAAPYCYDIFRRK